jgi:hypothetical protein
MGGKEKSKPGVGLFSLVRGGVGREAFIGRYL